MKSKASAMLADAVDAAIVGAKASPTVDTVALVRRILRARNPAALAEVEAGLVEEGRGESALEAWLARPLPSSETVDPLDAAARALAAASTWVTQLPPSHPKAAQFLGLIGGLAKTTNLINAGRPQVPTTDEVTARIEAVRDDAIRKVVEHTGDARAKLTAERKALTEWASTNLGPMIAGELERRVGAMLGEQTS